MAGCGHILCGACCKLNSLIERLARSGVWATTNCTYEPLLRGIIGTDSSYKCTVLDVDYIRNRIRHGVQSLLADDSVLGSSRQRDPHATYPAGGSPLPVPLWRNPASTIQCSYFSLGNHTRRPQRQIVMVTRDRLENIIRCTPAVIT